MFPNVHSRLTRGVVCACGAFIVTALLAGCGGGTPATVAAPPSYTAFNFVDAIGDLPFTLGSITAGPEGALWLCADTLSYGVIGRITTTGMATNLSGVPFDAYPESIAAGPDGALWYTVFSISGGPNSIGRLTTTGASAQYDLGGPIATGATAYAIAPGPDGAMWFTEYQSNQSWAIGRITPSGTISAFPLGTSAGTLDGITAGPDGALWFTSFTSGPGSNTASAGAIGRITTAGAVRTYPLPAGVGPGSITTGPDGALWFAEEFGGHIGRITTSGTISQFPLKNASLEASSIISGPDGALWFIQSPANTNGNAPGTSVVVRMSTSGATTEYPIPDLTNAGAIATGADGALWITSAQIWRLRP